MCQSLMDEGGLLVTHHKLSSPVTHHQLRPDGTFTAFLQDHLQAEQSWNTDVEFKKTNKQKQPVLIL